MHSEIKAKYSIFLAVCFLMLNKQCSKESYRDENYFGGKVMILGHRGMGELYPKPGNTYDAIFPVLGIGADGAEIDIQLTKDTVLVLFHDHTMDSRTSCSGRVYEKTWSEIKDCRYSSPLSLSKSFYINSVDDLFSRIPNLNNYYFSFDCGKVDFEAADIELYEKQYLRAIKRICEKYNMSNNVFIEGSVDLLIKAKELGLTNKLFALAADDRSSIESAYNNHFFGISIDHRNSEDIISYAHDKGLYVMVWSPSIYYYNKAALDKKADIIQSDDPISILKLLDRYDYEYTIP